MKNFTYLILAIIAAFCMPSCIEDSFTTSPSDQPEFSVDTLRMGEVYTLEGTPTHRFTVYNRHNKMLNISSISLRDDAGGHFRLNVDGISDRSFANVEIRANDSIFIFVEATLPENGTDELADINRHIDFVTNGVSQTVVFNVQGQDVIRLDDYTFASDASLEPGRPYLITDTLRVPQGVTLIIKPGARLRFREGAALKVDGRLIARGTADKQILMLGHRDGFVASTIPYELMSGQWGGVFFGEGAVGEISYASIRNSENGITLAPDATLAMTNSQVRNTTNYIIDAEHANTTLVGCELTDASNGILHLVGGKHTVNHCTIANYYLFTALGGPSIAFSHIDPISDDESKRPFGTAEFTNTIIYGNGVLLSHGDLTDTEVYIRRCLLGVAGSDDDNFIDCLWDEDPLYYTVRLEYLFDYRLKPESPAIGAADPAYDIFGLTTDRYGNPHTSPADLGAYTFVAPEE